MHTTCGCDHRASEQATQGIERARRSRLGVLSDVDIDPPVFRVAKKKGREDEGALAAAFYRDVFRGMSRS